MKRLLFSRSNTSLSHVHTSSRLWSGCSTSLAFAPERSRRNISTSVQSSIIKTRWSRVSRPTPACFASTSTSSSTAADRRKQIIMTLQRIQIPGQQHVYLALCFFTLAFLSLSHTHTYTLSLYISAALCRGLSLFLLFPKPHILLTIFNIHV